MNENVKTQKPESVPYTVYETTLARQEEQHKREREKDSKIIHSLIIAVIVMATVLFGAIIGFLVYESQYETISYTQDGEGLNNINTGEQGDVYGADAPYQEKEERQSESNQNP